MSSSYDKPIGTIEKTLLLAFFYVLPQYICSHYEWYRTGLWIQVLLTALGGWLAISNDIVPKPTRFQNSLCAFVAVGAIFYFYPLQAYQSHILWLYLIVAVAVVIEVLNHFWIAYDNSLDLEQKKEIHMGNMEIVSKRGASQEATQAKPLQQAQAVAVTQSQQDSTPPDPNTTPIRFVAKKSRHTFSDVSGMYELVERLKETSGDLRSNRGNGILLFGEPGNGKTFFAECLAGEMQVPMITLTYGLLASGFINVGTENLMKALADARRQAPCLFFFDEVDSLLSARHGNANRSEESDRMCNVLLTELVDMRKSGVYFVAATNFVDNLDAAAIREGRFDYKIEVPNPDLDARLNMISQPIERAKMEIDLDVLYSVAGRWEGFSVARIKQVVAETVRKATKEQYYEIDVAYLMAVLREVQGRAGSLPESAMSLDQLVLSADQRETLGGLVMRLSKIEDIEKLGGSVPRGVLFWGPPGTGKTVTAMALAKSSGWAFLSTSGNDLLSNDKAVDKLMRQASDLRPCIVFIDEADDVFSHRGANPGITLLTNKLLAAMDGTKGRVPDVLFVAATNHYDNFDPAALRGGRFTEKVEFRNPGGNEIIRHISSWQEKLRMPLAKSCTTEVIADLLEGKSNSDVREILQAAVNIAATRHLREQKNDHRITLEDLIAARTSVSGV